MAAPTKFKHVQRRRRGLAFSCWRFTLLLVLTYGVWHTLQCPLHSSSQQHPRGLPNGMMVDEEGINGANRFPTDLYSHLESSHGEVADPRNFNYFGRSIRSDPLAVSGTAAPKTIRACSNRLRYILTEICHGNFHNPSTIKRSTSTWSWPEQRGFDFAFRRVQRNVVNECCNKPCSIESLRKYCKDGSGSPMPSIPPTHVEAPSARVMEQSVEEVVEAEENEDETAADPVVQEQEPAIFSILRFLNYVVNRPANNPRFRTSSNSNERTLPIPQQRIQERPPDLETEGRAIAEGGQVSGGAVPDSTSRLRQGHHTSPANFVAEVNQDATFPSRTETGGHPNHHHHHSYSTAVVDKEENVHDEPGSGRNAVTSTLPPFLIRVGPLTSDYI